jgi:site-specific DNA recombinase
MSVFEIYRDDGVTGTIPLVERPEGKRLVEDARRGNFGTVIVKQVDRLGRDALHILNAVSQLESLNVKVLSIMEQMDLTTPQGRFMLTMYSGVAALERDTIVQRSIEGTNRLAREGAHLGGIVPYGYRQLGKGRDARLRVSDELIGDLDISEAEVVRSIYRWVVEEKQSTYTVADTLNSMGVPPAYTRDHREVSDGKRKKTTSGIWRPARVGNLIKNSTYKGVHFYGRPTVHQKNRHLCLIAKYTRSFESEPSRSLTELLLAQRPCFAKNCTSLQRRKAD